MEIKDQYSNYNVMKTTVLWTAMKPKSHLYSPCGDAWMPWKNEWHCCVFCSVGVGICPLRGDLWCEEITSAVVFFVIESGTLFFNNHVLLILSNSNVKFLKLSLLSSTIVHQVSWYE